MFKKKVLRSKYSLGKQQYKTAKTMIAVISALSVSLMLSVSALVMQRPASAATVSTTSSSVTISGLDLHDGTVQKFGSTYYLYGTMYRCGFNWGVNGTPWCGFGVSTAPSLNGPWSTPKVLFSPTARSAFRNMTWQQVCGQGGAGCFNPRMVQRTWGPNDGVYVLWFNAPSDYSALRANAYYVMGCNSPTGGCGQEAGPPYGSTFKPPMKNCFGNGDFSIVTNGINNPYIVCTNADQTLSIESLDYWGTSGIGLGSARLGGLTSVESPGIYHDTVSNKWVLTYSDPNCGYCAGDGTGYATADSLNSAWSVPVNTGVNPDPRGRRTISATSCGGQPRTVFSVDGQAYQWIDLWGNWNGNVTNQTNAGIVLVKLTYTPQAAPNGGVLPPQFAQWPCS